MTVLGQPAVSYTYDNADRLTQIAQGTSTVTLAYDTASRRTSLTLPNGVVTEYAYDAASRLTGLTYKNGPNVLGTLTYAYDNGGNGGQLGGTWARTGLPQAVASATYNAANHQLTFGGQTLTYDLNGNLTSDGTITSAWDARNRLASLTGGSATATFQYDPLGRRPRKVINGTTTDFLYDGVNPVQELSGGGVVANLLTALGIDEYLTRTDSAGMRALLADALGSTVALTDPAAAVQTQYTYEPFGGTTTSGPTSSNSFQYTGRENDGTGLQYYRARYYHPTFQRFISEDPIRLFGGDPNFYAYVGNDPLTFIDPLGLDKDCAFADVSSSTPLQVATDVAAGFGDAVSLGLTNVTRQLVGIDGQVRKNCGLYIAAEVTGIGWLIATNIVGGVTGAEITIGKWRFAPWGNRTGHPTGERPHYHRGRPDPNRPGDSLPGQGKGRHRPWDTKPPDKSFWDRF